MEEMIAQKKIKLWHAALFVVMFAGLLFVPHYLNNDIFFILNSGRYVIQEGIPYIEPFTMHQDWQFVMQQWLTCVIFWQIYANFGAIGLLAFVHVIAAATIYVYYRLCMMLSNKNWYISIALTTVVGIVICFLFMSTRPQIFSSLLLLWEVFFLEKYVAQRQIKYLLFLPLVSVALVNMHAALWGLSVCVLLAYICAAMKNFQRNKKELLYLAVSLLAVVIAGFVNPYGSGAMLYGVNSYGISLINIMVAEMMPAAITEPFGKFIFAVILLTWMIYLKRGIKLRHVFLCLGMTYLALSANRSLFLFLILATFPLAACWQSFKLDFSVNQVTQKQKIFRVVMVSAILLVGGRTIYQHYTADDNYQENLEPKYPAVDYLLTLAAPEDIRLWNSYDSGGYVEFRGIKAYLDPRAEVFFAVNNGQDDVFREYTKTIFGMMYYEDVFDKYDINYILTKQSEMLFTFLAHDPNYELLYEDQYADNGATKYRLYHRLTKK